MYTHTQTNKQTHTHIDHPTSKSDQKSPKKWETWGIQAGLFSQGPPRYTLRAMSTIDKARLIIRGIPPKLSKINDNI